MDFNVVILGFIALTIWCFIYFVAKRGVYGWISPISLFALGLLVLYIVPALYWQFRPWPYMLPPYFEGLHLVFISTITFSLPFVFNSLYQIGNKRISRKIVSVPAARYGRALWICVVPVLIGIGWRLHMITLGYQSRLARANLELFGSEELAYLFGNISYYYAAFYFALVAFGNKRQRQVGVLFWIFDAMLQVYTLHRYSILIFVFRSIVFLTIAGYRLSRKQWVGIVISVIFVISIIGSTAFRASQLVTAGKAYLTPGQAVDVVGEIAGGVVTGEGVVSSISTAIDDTMFRLYEARSASAVMMGVPDTIPYFNGATFMQVFYSFIPRYFWASKPDLFEIQAVTILVMPNDSGVNPAGSLAELYMNFGLLAVFLGGCVCLFLCRWTDSYLNMNNIGPALICSFPIIAELFIAANMSLTRRLCEGVRGLMILGVLTVIFKICKQKMRNNSGKANEGIKINGGCLNV